MLSAYSRTRVGTEASRHVPAAAHHSLNFYLIVIIPKGFFRSKIQEHHRLCEAEDASSVMTTQFTTGKVSRQTRQSPLMHSRAAAAHQTRSLYIALSRECAKIQRAIIDRCGQENRLPVARLSRRRRSHWRAISNACTNTHSVGQHRDLGIGPSVADAEDSRFQM